jgi:uncharacterized protein
LVEGEVIPPDYAEARRWALAAAEQGIAAAMTRLGMMFHNALGVPRDPAQAVHWWRRGAQHGDADGQAMLGAALHLGNGVSRDPVMALAWLLHARDAGSALASPFLGPAHTALCAVQIAEAHRHAATLPSEVKA